MVITGCEDVPVVRDMSHSAAFVRIRQDIIPPDQTPEDVIWRYVLELKPRGGLRRLSPSLTPSEPSRASAGTSPEFLKCKMETGDQMPGFQVSSLVHCLTLNKP